MPAMMLRLLLISCAAGPAFADQFPVQLMADTGAPKKGEGLGGVAVLLKPMPEATTMKTWSFLKESMMKIGDQVKQILQVRNDMALLQKDLSLQEKLWKQAEISLNQENAKLRAEAAQAKMQVEKGAKVKRELVKVKQDFQEEKRNTADLQNAAAMKDKQWKLEFNFLEQRKNNVTALQKQVNETASLEISRAEAVHLQLQKDAVTLRLAVGDFKDRQKNGQEKMEFDNTKSLSQQAELKRQIAAMKEGLARIKSKLKPRHIFDKEEQQLKLGLQKETATILGLQSKHQQIVTECTKEMQEQDAIKCSEEGKLRRRLQEKTQFCNAITVQNQVLKQDLAKCGQLVGIAPPAAAPAAATSKLADPVPLRDEQRVMAQAPAPAPAPGAFM